MEHGCEFDSCQLGTQKMCLKKKIKLRKSKILPVKNNHHPFHRFDQCFGIENDILSILETVPGITDGIWWFLCGLVKIWITPTNENSPIFCIILSTQQMHKNRNSKGNSEGQLKNFKDFPHFSRFTRKEGTLVIITLFGYNTDFLWTPESMGPVVVWLRDRPGDWRVASLVPETTDFLTNSSSTSYQRSGVPVHQAVKLLSAS